MFSALLAIALFMTCGYAFAAATLLILYAAFRKSGHLPGLGRCANGALAFYMLCRFLLDLVALLRSQYRFADIASQVLPAAAIVLLVMIPFLQKRSLLLLVPLSILGNWNNFAISGDGVFASTDSGTILASIWRQEPYLLLLFGVGYCLLTLVLYLISLWINRFLAKES